MVVINPFAAIASIAVRVREGAEPVGKTIGPLPFVEVAIWLEMFAVPALLVVNPVTNVPGSVRPDLLAIAVASLCTIIFELATVSAASLFENLCDKD